MYVLPDPYATLYTTEDVMTVADGLTTEINAVTEATFGAATVASTAVEEVACSFVNPPAATADKKSFAVAGTTDVEGYVYCWATKEGTAKPAPVVEAAARLLVEGDAAATDATATDATATDATATDAATDATATDAATDATATDAATEDTAAAADDTEMSPAEWAAAHTVKRVKTATPDFAFSHTFTTDEGKVYKWGCYCTSLSPGSPYESAEVDGEVETLETLV